MSYTVIITEEIAANVAVTTQNYPITIEYNATNISDGSNYGNANVAAYLAANTALPITTTANVTAGAFIGSGAGLTGITVSGSNVSGAVANATYATTAGSATSAGTANVATVAYSVAAGNIVGTVANATYADTAGSATTAGTANAVAGANVSGTVANATYATTAGSATTATSATTAGTVTTAAQPNITSVGTLSSLSVSGNITGGTLLGNGSVPGGGDADTYLVKDSATDYDYSWTDRVNAKTIYENVKNVSGSTLTKGTPVYQIGVTGNTITVGVARADDPAKLAVGVLDVELADQAEGRMLVLGEIKGVNTASFATGDEVYLGATGGYTNVKPTSSSVAIQFLGVVNRVDANNGSGFITGTLTPDAVKYATYAQVWTGTAWVPATELSSDTTPALAGDLAMGAYNISGTGNVSAARVTTTSDVIVGGNLTVNGDTVYTNITTFTVEDPVIEMGRGANDAPLVSDDGKDRGSRLWYYSGSEKSAFAGYDNSAGKMVLATDVSITDEVVTVNAFGNTQVGNLDAANVSATNFIAPAGGAFLGDFSNANASLRTAIQNSSDSTNASTFVFAKPGVNHIPTTSSGAGYGAFNSPDIGNANFLGTYVFGNATQFRATASGTATPTDIVFKTGTYPGGTTAFTIKHGGDIEAISNVVAGVDVSATGNVQGTYVTASTDVIASGNVQGTYILGDGSQLTNLPTTTPGGNTSEVQFNNAGAFAGDSLFTWDTGNAIANIANVNIQSNRINNTTAYAVPSSTVMNPGQLLIGNGFNGNTEVGMDFFNRVRNARLGVWGSHEQSGAAGQSAGITGQEVVTLTADWTNTNPRAFGVAGVLQVGGQGTYNSTSLSTFNLAAQAGFTMVGNSGNSQPGNITVACATGSATGVGVTSGSTLNNAVGFATVMSPQGGSAGNIVAFSSGGQGSGTVTGEYIGFYNPSSTNNYGAINSSLLRQAPGGYWAFKNDDAVATVQLGSLKRYHEFTDTSNSTSGNITINKDNGQIQQITPSANITIDGFSNFVTTADNSSTTFNQTDTVTLTIVNTGGYDITMPTGSAYKYSGNTSTVGNTAGSVTLISVSAIDISSTTTYLITISPEFV